ncbi:outer membrane beta-barrel protein [Flavisolibacter ginsengisoli]|jgi:hypothetical protein|uniref:Outer membrane receptor for ferrienterochelin and colicins n=1 Tax=Flavisolibacter ginsengisoli DSM 18119 TaxID=1121884 RepID=A0A1M4WQN5_9BACT|nr:outer membrane beta-barrel protein [Flavisolibacter ginsengisoli]SHE83549.1 Outer membrane receptor for ferrienterochelin and colicins [Flavisolibacter ginsengisoli DSM 18119]
MKRWVLLIFIAGFFNSWAQEKNVGILTGAVLDEQNKALGGATVQLLSFRDTFNSKTVLTGANGDFEMNNIPFGFYKLKISYTGLQTVVLDSIYFRMERFDFNLNDIILKPNEASGLDVVIVYAEKPLIQSKDGNITFNAGESALSAGSNASDLLANVPLISKDPSGKIMVRGKSPKILIDDKPVELNLEQLQDLLESMPGSSIEKIEVLTNPPPQYAGEEGGVINIVTRKGTVGINGRVSVYAGTRGEEGGNISLQYRKQGLTFSMHAGAGYNIYVGNGYYSRIYTNNSALQSVNHYRNDNLRPNGRASVNYDVNKYHNLNFVLQYNQNHFNNFNNLEYIASNANGEITRLFDRTIHNKGVNYSPDLTLSYTAKTRRAGEAFQVISSFNRSDNTSSREFYEEYFNPDHSASGKDSTQRQVMNNYYTGKNIRLNYDLPFDNKKTFISLGSYYNTSRSDMNSDASFLNTSSLSWDALEALTNHFLYYQHITNMRGSIRQLFGEDFNISTGLAAEKTSLRFNLFKSNSIDKNAYWNYLPFARLSKNWNKMYSLSLSYRRTIRRPGVNEMNPTIDSSDQYNIRYGNLGLKPSLSNNFDLVVGKSKNGAYSNIALGYNQSAEVFSQIRISPQEITWQNISGSREYEISSWNGLSIHQKVKLNMSGRYAYRIYSAYDKENRKFKDGGSLSFNLNGNYNWKDLYSATGSFTYNRYANPQGATRSSLGMNMGFQARLLEKKLVVNLTITDPFLQQENRSWTFGTGFTQENYNSAQTRNFRLTLSYVFSNNGSSKKMAAIKKVFNNQKPAP